MTKRFCILILLVALPLFASVATAAESKPVFPSWSEQINTSKRFAVLAAFDNAAVLDNETGLVWERVPDTTARDFYIAHNHCNNLNVGNRKGWRLPAIQELASLIDPTNPGGNPDLPVAHPFTVLSSSYWSGTTFAGIVSGAWFVSFSDGEVGSDFNGNPNFVWCVRGGQGVDPHSPPAG
jgi:hypothetical protein